MDNSVKGRILNIANRVICEKGLNHFTLDEVAKEAGVSKGGLLYHYPSKDSLIKGLIEYHTKQFEESILERQKAQPDSSLSDWFTFFVEEQFNQTKVDTNTMAGFLAAIAMNQDLLQPIKEKARERLDRVEQLKDPIMGIIISFACEGMAFSKLFGLDVLPDETRVKVMERMVKLIEGYC